jgi:Ni2+-binding GTPase involved in maturation of urease and hydrogenase
LLTNVIIKTIKQIKKGSGTVVVFSDMIENNDELNMYKNAFNQLNPADVIPKLVSSDDPNKSVVEELKEFKNLKNIKLLIVRKQESTNRIKTADVSLFWMKFFKELNINTKVVDNLSQIEANATQN